MYVSPLSPDAWPDFDDSYVIRFLNLFNVTKDMTEIKSQNGDHQTPFYNEKLNVGKSRQTM